VAEMLPVFFTDEGDHGWSAESPGVPGFVMGRRTLAELRADLPGALRFAGVSDAIVLPHVTERFVTPEGDEFTVRRAEDAHRIERQEVFGRLLLVMETDQRIELMRAARTPTSEVSFVCAVATDTLGWLRGQLYDGDDVVTIALAVAENGIFSTQMSSDPHRVDQGWTWVDAFGWNEGTTLGEVMVGLSGRPERDRLLVTN
jgi:hypothetical protein